MPVPPDPPVPVPPNPPAPPDPPAEQPPPLLLDYEVSASCEYGVSDFFVDAPPAGPSGSYTYQEFDSDGHEYASDGYQYGSYGYYSDAHSYGD